MGDGQHARRSQMNCPSVGRRNEHSNNWGVKTHIEDTLTRDRDLAV